MGYRVLSDLRFRRPDSYGKALFRHSLKKRITVISLRVSVKVQVCACSVGKIFHLRHVALHKRSRPQPAGASAKN